MDGEQSGRMDWRRRLQVHAAGPSGV
jgi:hypothetical protein